MKKIISATLLLFVYFAFPSVSFAQIIRGTQISGTPLAWVTTNKLWYLNNEFVYEYNIKDNSHRKIEKLSLSSSGFYNCSNSHAFGSLRADPSSKIASHKIDWKKPIKLTPVKRIFSGTVNELTCSLDKSVLNKIKKSTKGYISNSQLKRPVGSRNWGGQGFFFSETTRQFDSNSREWPLKAVWTDGRGNITKRDRVPKGPWNWKQGALDTLKNFSCGTSCYVRFTPFAVEDTIYAWVYGKAVPSRGRGIFRLLNNSWEKIYSGALARKPLISDDGSRMALVSKESDVTLLKLK